MTEYVVAEKWRAVVGYEGYYIVSDRGRVKRVRAARGATIGRVLRPSKHSRGYRLVTLARDAHHRRRYVHELVAAAFIGPRPRGAECNHKNLDKADNRLSNLEWVTQSENMRHAVAHGVVIGKPLRGEANPRSKLTAAQVRAIRASTDSQRQAAARFCVSKSAIAFIRRGETWRTI